MFTGLVERTGRITSITNDSPEMVRTLLVDPGADYERSHGASIAVNGVCLSEVRNVTQGILTFHVSPETWSLTSLSGLDVGSLVNLERAMRPTDRLGGHIMLGHVDDTGEITAIHPQEGFWHMEIKIQKRWAKYVIHKGSIAIDGVSLTINAIQDKQDATYLSFMLIPVTWTTTRFHEIHIGNRVNIEIDMIAKHLERLVSVSLSK